MKRTTLSIALAMAVLAMSAAQASEFKGAYIGADVGYNTNSRSNSVVAAQNKGYLGAQAGYNWDLNNWVVGAVASYDAHNKSVTSNDANLDAKLGYAMGNLMPYAKLGAAFTTPNTRVHGGLGLEYKFAPQWSAFGEWTADASTYQNNKYKNSNIALGINYYFDKPAVAAAVVAVAAPVVMKKAEPVAAPAPVVAAPAPVVAPAPAPKTIFTDKPVTLEGANFATSSSKLKAGDIADLDKVVEFAAVNKDANLTVTGFTDSRGNDKANQTLSAKRAEAVKAYLVKKGVSADRISTEGKGSANPVADNKTKAGQAQNRRVEVDSSIRVKTVK